MVALGRPLCKGAGWPNCHLIFAKQNTQDTIYSKKWNFSFLPPFEVGTSRQNCQIWVKKLISKPTVERKLWRKLKWRPWTGCLVFATTATTTTVGTTANTSAITTTSAVVTTGTTIATKTTMYYYCLTWCLVFQLRSVGLKRGRHCQVGIVLVLLVQLAHCVHCACTMFQQRHCPAVRHQQQLQERHCDDKGDVGNIVIKSDDSGDIVIKCCASWRRRTS